MIPKLAKWMLSKILRGYHSSTVLADLEEEFEYISEKESLSKAKIWYWKQTIKSIPHFINNSITWGITMFFNFIKVALRNFNKNKSITAINLSGLAIGMACAILIMFWVQNQFSYDKSQKNRDSLVRLETETWVVQPPYFVEEIQDFPEIDNAVRFFFWYSPMIKRDEINFTLDNLAITDTSVFTVFNFEFLAGNSKNVLHEPNSIVLTESMAKKLFGNTNPVGKTVLLNNSYEFTVKAVVADINDLHMNINAFISVYDRMRNGGQEDFITSANSNFLIYLKLNPKVDKKLLADKIYKKVTEGDKWRGDNIILRPFNDIYFTQGLQYENNVKHGNYSLIIAFVLIAVFILAIACINFVNLTIAKATKREKEIAVRKVSGAGKASIQWQVFGETTILVFFSFILSILIVYLTLPQFQAITNEVISINWTNPSVLLIIISTFMFTSVLAGVYPAMMLAAKEPITILKNRFAKDSNSAILSKVLVTIQFTVTIVLIISAVTVLKQLSFMQNKDLGFNHEQIVYYRLQGSQFWGGKEKVLQNKETFRNTLMANPSIKGVTYTAQVPGDITNTWGWYTDNEEETVEIKIMNVDPEFIDVMEIELLEGRKLSLDNQSDFHNKYIVNQEAVRRLKLEDPFSADINPGNIEIVGVVKDFNFNSLHRNIEPLAIRWQYWNSTACVKTAGTNISNTLEFLKNTYSQFCPGYAFEYSFLDESFAKQYEAEKRLEEILSYFVFIAIILSSLGLFALTALFAEQKTKEIGIRKVLGSSIPGIIYFISKDFLIRVIIANIVAWPIAYLIIESWLEEYAYRIDMSLDIFLISGISTIFIALATVFWQAYKAAKQNPVESLKYE